MHLYRGLRHQGEQSSSCGTTFKTAMSSAEYLKRFVSDRLASAAEEIFQLFQKTIAEYEEELRRQRRLLNVAWSSPPVVHLHRLPERDVSVRTPEKETKEAVILESKSSLNEARLSGVDQEKPEPPQVKGQVEELSSGELGLKREPEDLQLYSADGGSDRSGDTVVERNPEESSGDSGVPVIVSVVSEANTDLSLCPGVSQSLVQKNGKCKNSRSTGHKWNDPTSGCHITSKDQNNSVPDSKVQKNVQVHIGKTPHVCEVCGFKLSSRRSLSRHMGIHSDAKSYACPVCSKGFRTESNLKEHQKTHTGEGPYVCQTCSTAFVCGIKFKKHMRLHTGEKRFVCHTCGKRFTQKAHLQRHERNHTGERPFVCQTCGKGFIQKFNLKLHQHVHTREKPHACPVCGRRFSQKSTMNRHLRIHTGERPYVCQTCGKGFPLKSSLLYHGQSHTGVKPYTCKPCGKGFACASSYRCHVKLKHQDQTSSVPEHT